MINKRKESNETKQQKEKSNDKKLSSQKEPIKFMNP